MSDPKLSPNLQKMNSNANDSSVTQDLHASQIRMFDANANRCMEGLRVIEDALRFVFDNERFAAALKHLRHRVATTVERMPLEQRLSYRDTQNDVGTAIEATDEYERHQFASVIRANFSRVQQSLRVLEELSKSLLIEDSSSDGSMSSNVSAARELEQARYKIYELEKEIFVEHFQRADEESSKCQRLDWNGCRLYVLMPCGEDLDAFESRVRELIAGGVDAIQLRDKSADDQTLLDAARRLVTLTRPVNVAAIVNDRPDIARLADADAVHVGQDELSVNACRQIISNHCSVGVSTHSLEQAKEAQRNGADYIGIGPIFPSETKSFDDTIGVEVAKDVVATSPLPAFGIGGVSREQLDVLINAGIERVAISHAIWSHPDPQEEVSYFKSRLSRGTLADISGQGSI